MGWSSPGTRGQPVGKGIGKRSYCTISTTPPCYHELLHPTNHLTMSSANQAQHRGPSQPQQPQDVMPPPQPFSSIKKHVAHPHAFRAAEGCWHLWRVCYMQTPGAVTLNSLSNPGVIPLLSPFGDRENEAPRAQSICSLLSYSPSTGTDV